MKKIAWAPFPPLRDARYVQLAVLLAYAVVAREIFHFERSHLITLLCCGITVGLDFLFGVVKYRLVRPPLSPLIIGLATSLLIDSRAIHPYALAAGIAACSKALLTYRGRHYFNPANLGVVLVLLLDPGHVTAMPTLFAGFLWPSVVFGIVGLATVIYARQLEVSLSWILGFLVFALMRSLIAHADPAYALGVMTGPSFLLFSFHMISDPATTPRLTRNQIAFGVGTAAVDAVLRYLEVPNGMFYSLGLVSALLPWIRDVEPAAGGGGAPISSK